VLLRFVTRLGYIGQIILFMFNPGRANKVKLSKIPLLNVVVEFDSVLVSMQIKALCLFG